MAEDWIVKAPDLAGIGRISKLLSKSTGLFGIDSDGDLVQFDDVSAWVQRATGVFAATSVFALHSDNLYTIALGHLNQYDNVSAWSEITTTDIFGGGFRDAISFNGNIYAGEEILYEYAGGTGEPVAVTGAAPGSVDGRISKLLVFEGELYQLTVVGELYKWNGTNAWVLMAPSFGGSNTTVALFEFENSIYCIYENTGHLFKWNGTNVWLDQNPGEGSRFSSSGVVFNNFIYRGSGSVGGSGLWKYIVGTQTFEEINNDSLTLSFILTLYVFNSKIMGAGL